MSNQLINPINSHGSLFDPSKAIISIPFGEAVSPIELKVGQVWNCGSGDEFEPVRICSFGLSLGKTWVEYDWYEKGKRFEDMCELDDWLKTGFCFVAQLCDKDEWEKGKFVAVGSDKLAVLNTLPVDKNQQPREKIKANEICQQAIDTMAERGKAYDTDNQQEERSIGKTVAAFNTLTGHSLTETQGCLFMVILKMARSQQGEYKHDNFLDGTAYFALAGEAASIAK